MTDPVTLKLKTPITAHGEELTSLTFRPPVGRELQLCGAPFSVSESGDGDKVIHPKYSVVGKYIVHLAGIPPSSVDKLSAADFRAASEIIFGFFGEEEPKTPAPPTEPKTPAQDS